MFGFLKDKLKSVVDKFSKKVEESPNEEIIEVEQEKPKQEKPKFEKTPKKEESKKPKAKEKPKKERKASKEEQETKEKIKKIKEGIEKLQPIEEAREPEPIQEKPLEESSAEKKEDIEKEFEQPKKGFFSKLFKKKEIESEKSEPKEEKPAEKTPEKETEQIFEKPKTEEEPPQEQIEEPEKKSFFSKITEKVTTKKITEEQFEELFWELELSLLESNVAVEVIEKIKQELKEKLVEKPIKKSEINSIILRSLKESIEDLFSIPAFNLLEKIKEKKPYIICFIGINGSGKTTTIAKLAHLLQKNKLSCVLAASDTFRAAAIQQLEEHANNLKIKLIKHDYGADSAAVAFDAIKHAEARHLDVVLIDTAGRLHSNEDLMKEMQKLVRIAKPDLKIFVGESITGNDCVEQAKQFNNLIGIDGIILSKADIDDKGGAALSVSYITKKPILYLGTGQSYDDLTPFNKDQITKNLGL